jgi:hypothetical protein
MGAIVPAGDTFDVSIPQRSSPKQFKQLRMENTPTVAPKATVINTLLETQLCSREYCIKQYAVNKRANQFILMIH